MRICNICKENEPRNKSSSYCKSCHNIKMQEYYKNNTDAVKARVNKRRKEIRNMVKKAKEIPCQDCNISYPYYVMDLDHKPGVDKKFNLSEAAKHNKAIKTVQNEIDKCDTVCANCHRERTFNRYPVV